MLATEAIVSRFLIKNTDFFLKKNYRRFDDDITRERLGEITDVDIQCLGYGIFNKKQTLQNFYSYIRDLLKNSPKQLKSLKITLNGFDVTELDGVEILQKIASLIREIKENLKTLSFHTANLINVTMEDFEVLLRLSHDLTDINFEQFSLQCANWKFAKKQPTFAGLYEIFERLVRDCGDGGLNTIKNKQFRLEMSGWFYEIGDAKYFLGFRLNEEELKKVSERKRELYSQGRQYHGDQFDKELEKFHNEMERLVKGLLDVMDQIQELQLDMRNAHDILKMKNLKKKLDNVTKDNRYEKSIMSKKYDVQADQAEKQLKLTIVM